MDNLCHPWKCQGDGDGHKMNNYIHILLRLVLPIMLFLFEWDTSVCTILKIWITVFDLIILNVLSKIKDWCYKKSLSEDL